jgi:hypothetical protein
VGAGRRWGKYGRVYCVHMNVNEKMRLLKLFQEWERGGKRRMVEEMNSSMIYLIYCKNYCKCHNVPHPAQQ